MSSLYLLIYGAFKNYMKFSTIDVIVFVSYCLLIVGIGLYVSKDKKGHQKNAEDYFLAGKTLPWWAIGASLIAANISAEQFIGMSGSGFAPVSYTHLTLPTKA